MAINISNRPDNHIKKVEIPHKNKKSGLNFETLALIAIIAVLLDSAAITYSRSMNSMVFNFFRFLGSAAVPVSAFLTAQLYHLTRNKGKTFLLLGFTAIAAHVPYVMFHTGKFGIFSASSLMFTLFMGYVALMIADMRGLEPNVQTALMLIVCLMAMFGDGGSAAAVWVYIFGSSFDKNNKIRLFCITGIVMLILDFISNGIGGNWLAGIYETGLFLAIPFISRYNYHSRRQIKAMRYGITYAVILLCMMFIRKLVY